MAVDSPAAMFLELALMAALALLLIGAALVVMRLIRGPTFADRVLALDLLTGLGISLIAAFSILSGYFAYLDVAIALGLVGFLTTAAFARFIERRAIARARAEDDMRARMAARAAEGAETEAVTALQGNMTGGQGTGGQIAGQTQGERET